MKSVLLCFIAAAFALLVSSCGDDPVSSGVPSMTPAYHASLLAHDGWFGQVIGTAPDDVYAIGSVVLHYDGKEWAPVTLPDDPRSARDGIAFADGKFVICDGYAMAVRDGSKWSKIKSPGNYIENLWGLSATDFYAIGFQGISHYDGTSWTPMVLPGETDYPFAMAGRSATDIIATGRWGAIYRFDGSQWSTARVDSFYHYRSLAITQSGLLFAADGGRVLDLNAATPQVILDEKFDEATLCADGDALYASGPVRFSDYRDPQFSIQRYANGAWQQVAKEKGFPRSLLAANGSLVVGGEDNLIWRGTDQGGQFDQTYPRRAFMTCAINIDDAIFAAGLGAYRYENGVWTDLNKEYISQNTAWAIAGRTPREVYAVGDHMVLQYDGEKWSWINGGFGKELRAAWVDANGDLLAAGEGSIFRKHRDDWFSETIPHDPRWIYAMWGDDNAVYGVGSQGLIAVRRNGEWLSMASGTSSNLYTVWGFDERHVYAAGENNNELCLYDGRTWQPVAITSVDLENFQSLWGNSPSDFWAADYRGIVAHYDGQRWTELERIFTRDLTVVRGNRRETLAFGYNGIISYHR